MDYRKKELFHEALFELIEEDLVEVTWEKYREGEKVHKVYLNLDCLDKAFRMSSITPKEEKLELILETISALSSHPWDWVVDWLRDAEKCIPQFRIPVGCDLDDQAANEDLVKTMLALPEIDNYLPKRRFSQQVLLDSKRFEQVVEKRLLSIYKNYGAVSFETDEEYLDSLGIVEHARLSLIAGAMHIQLDGSHINIGNFKGGLGISSESIVSLEIDMIEARRIICVENLTSYQLLIMAIQQRELESTIVIYTGGFPHRSLQKLLRKIADFISLYNESMPVYHWGDLDLGGIRIFNFIKSNFFPNLHPYLMDVNTYKSLLDSGTPFEKDYETKLSELMDNTEYSEWNDLLNMMLKHRKKIEQESIGLWQLI